MVIRKIISGGQTGADRAALDAALALGFPVGGWVPRGRRAEDGPVPDGYPNLRETDTEEYETRTRWNVRDADATLILSHGPLTGGSKFTEDVARSLGKPVRHVDLGAMSIADAVSEIRTWLSELEGETLNVAGTRTNLLPFLLLPVSRLLPFTDFVFLTKESPGMSRRISKESGVLTYKVEQSILLVRGEKVILDYVLAKMYGVSTKVLLQAVRRNAERFPPDFMYQLSVQEVSNLRSQFVTSSWGGRRRRPYAFTVFDAIRELMAPTAVPEKRRIGFHEKDE